MEKIYDFTIYVWILVVFSKHMSSGLEYMVTVPEPISLPLGFETLLTCEMNVEPDTFLWKFYPTEDAYDPTAYIDLKNGTFKIITVNKDKQRKKSGLKLKMNSTDVAGDYQCVAFYGSSAVASIPWRVTLTTIQPFPKQEPVKATVLPGNTVLWRCIPPHSNPEAYVDYYKNNKFLASPFLKSKAKPLIIPAVESRHSGLYTCRATNTMKDVNSSTYLDLNVNWSVPSRAPYFIVEPKSSYTALKGKMVFLECAAVGNPVPEVEWSKKNGHFPTDRVEKMSGGLKIHNVSSSDEGIYICNHTNTLGTITYSINLIYNEEPTIECYTNHTEVRQGENLDIECGVRGIPKPDIGWFINGFSVTNDTSIESARRRIHFRPVEKWHNGNLQLFARNTVKTVSANMLLDVIPLEKIVETVTPHHRLRQKAKQAHRHKSTSKILPPGKPTISRLDDESVVVRWTVPHNPGLSIQFFKVQYREMGPARDRERNRTKAAGWKTPSADIAAHLRDYDVTGLKPDHIYRFRVAAVYSNNDHKLSPNSDKFHLGRIDFGPKSLLPIPVITRTESINTTTVRVHWKCRKDENVTIDGFYISYMSASTVGDYMKATIDGSNTNDYIISYLQPDTVYDVKLQSFNSRFASDFSSITKAKTRSGHRTHQVTTISPLVSSASTEKPGLNVYVIVAGAIIGCALLICGIALIFICRKWKQKKSVDNRHQNATDNHNGNEYAVETMSIPRANGTVSSRITITSNPLAEADNKNQNMIEMSRLQTQNNNCASQSASAGVNLEETPMSSSTKDKVKRSMDKSKNRRVLAGEKV